MASDTDEIPKLPFVQALASCKLPQPFPRLVLQCDSYYYSFEFHHASYEYSNGGTASRFSSVNDIPRDIRRVGSNHKLIPGVCFHCSYCFDRIATVRQKLGSFSHTELDIDKYRSQQNILDAYRYGKDLFGRVEQQLKLVNITQIDLPQLLKLKPDRFSYMLNRSSLPNAGFRDLT